MGWKRLQANYSILCIIGEFKTIKCLERLIVGIIERKQPLLQILPFNPISTLTGPSIFHP